MSDILGTIIASVLNYDQLCKSIGETQGFNSKKSSYAPCDGRSIVGSCLANKAQHNNAPDLRGKFLRGLNEMYGVGQPLPFDPNTYGDPQSNRVVGDYQPDAFQGHWHDIQTNDNSVPSPGGINGFPQNYNHNTAKMYNGYLAAGATHLIADDIPYNSAPRATVETRPKNVSIYYYIKIN